MLWFQRERTPFQAVLYGLYLYALGLSFRRVSDALEPFVQRSYVEEVHGQSLASEKESEKARRERALQTCEMFNR
jgi:hypothetical protein